jgi:hypothetical protein
MNARGSYFWDRDWAMHPGVLDSRPPEGFTRRTGPLIAALGDADVQYVWARFLRTGYQAVAQRSLPSGGEQCVRSLPRSQANCPNTRAPSQTVAA